MGKLETCVQQKFRKKRQQGKWSPLYTAGPTGRTWHEGQAETQQKALSATHGSRGRAQLTPLPRSLFQRGRRKQGLWVARQSCCAGAQWEAVAEERMIISPHSDPLEGGGGTGNAASLLPIATLSPCAGLGNSKAAVSSGCLTASLSGVCLSLVLPGLLCHSQMTGINQDCSWYSGG